jgi:hypothetical protein
LFCILIVLSFEIIWKLWNKKRVNQAGPLLQHGPTPKLARGPPSQISPRTRYCTWPPTGPSLDLVPARPCHPYLSIMASSRSKDILLPRRPHLMLCSAPSAAVDRTLPPCLPLPAAVTHKSPSSMPLTVTLVEPPSTTS